MFWLKFSRFGKNPTFGKSAYNFANFRKNILKFTLFDNYLLK